MVRFVKNIILFAVLAFLIPALLAFLLPSNPDGFFKVYLVKEQRAISLPEPRILICGGSDVLHAIDSKLIKDSLHRDVVNFGLTAALGYDLYINDALKYSKKGDVVLLSTGASVNSPVWGGPDEIPVLIDYDHNKIWDLKWGNIKQLGSGVFCLLKMKIKYVWYKLRGVDLSQTYSFGKFDENGDYKKVLNTEYVKRTVVGEVSFSQEQINFMESVCRRVKMIEEKGCQVFIIPETVEQETFSILSARISAIRSYYEAKGLKYLFPPEKAAVPDSMIFNSQFHVNYRGTKLFSDLIIMNLKDYLNQ